MTNLCIIHIYNGHYVKLYLAVHVLMVLLILQQFVLLNGTGIWMRCLSSIISDYFKHVS